MYQYRTVAITLFCMIQFRISAQNSFVFVKNSADNSEGSCGIELKWYRKGRLYDGKFNVYRRGENDSDWILLNALPLERQKTVSQEALSNDDELAFFQEMLTSSSVEELKDDFLTLTFLLKSFESTDFARLLGLYFKDSTAQWGLSYEYRITVLDASGSETELGLSGGISVSDYSSAPPVSGVEVYQEGRTINFNWVQNDKSFYAYNLYQLDSSNHASRLNDQPIMLTMQPDSSGQLVYPRPMFRQRGFREGQLYRFFIEGVDYFGDPSFASKHFSIEFDDTTPPSPPRNLNGRSDSLRVTLRWDQEATPDLKGFVVYRSGSSEGSYEQVSNSDISPEMQHYFEILQVPGAYYYFVEAEDHSGNKSRSEPTFIEAQDVFPPPAPEGLTIQSDTGRLYLNWQKNMEADLAGYLIYRTVDQDNKDNYVLLNAEPIDTNYFEQKLPKNVRNKFFYFLVAVDTSYNRSKPSAIASAGLPDVVAPEVPTIKEIKYSDEGIVIGWVPNVEQDLAGYHVYRQDSLQSNPVQINQALLVRNAFRFTDRSARPNTEYFYTLSAIDSTGNKSDLSESAYALRHQEETIKASLSLKLKSHKRKKANRLEWEEIDSDQVRGYVVFRGTSEGSIKPITNVLETTTTYTDTGLLGDSYVYQVRAYVTTGQVIYSKTVEWKSK